MTNRIRQWFEAASCVFLIVGSAAMADVPLMMNHQGLVKVNGEPFTGVGLFKFGFLDSTGRWLWTNDGTHIGDAANDVSPDQALSLPASNGVYNVRLGDTQYTNMVPIPDTVFDQTGISLRIIFDDGTTGEQTITPDRPLSTVAYAYRAREADKVGGRTIDQIDLVGEVKMWAGPVAAIPEGWLFCDGSEVSRSSYSQLFSVIGEIYGAGDGSTTFNVPDLRDRSPIGATQDDGGVPKTNVTGTLTQMGGEAEHTLTVEEIPSHSHKVPEDSAVNQGLGSGQFPEMNPLSYRGERVSTGSEGGGQPHSNLDPFLAMVFIIKH